MKKKSNYIIKSSDLNVDSRTITGYASIFNEFDNSGDRVFKGSFSRSISEWGVDAKNKIKFYYNHQPSPIGVLKELREDDKGLFFKAEFGKYDIGERVFGQVKQGALNELSFGGFGLISKNNDKGGKDYSDIKLFELSVVDYADQEMSQITYVSKSKDTYVNEMYTLIWKESKKIRNQDIKFNIQRYLLSLFNDEPLSPKQEDITKSVEPNLQIDLNKILEKQLDTIKQYQF